MKRVTKEFLVATLSKRTVIVGVGNVMRGDDTFGPSVVRRVEGRIRADVIDAGMVPENFLGKIATFEPETVLLLDAVDFGGQPGDVVLLEPEDLATTNFGTHLPSLSLLESFLSAEGDVGILVLAAQPVTTELDAPLSEEMGAAIEETARMIEEADRARAGEI